MDIQLKAGLFKEIAAFVRTKKFLILICVFIGTATLYPLMIRGMSLLVYAMSDIYAEMGIDVTEMSYVIITDASLGVADAVGVLVSIGLMVFLLLINSFSGGEEKRRSIMIPQSSGLDVFNYLLPKYIVYPLAIFAFTLAGVFLASGVIVLVYENNDLIMRNVVIAATLAGIYNMFYVCLHLTLGTSSGKAGMSAAICIVASMLLPGIFTIVDAVPVYNPLTMGITASMVATGAELRPGIITGVILTFLLMAAVFLVALFAQTAKKIDNKGNEIII